MINIVSVAIVPLIIITFSGLALCELFNKKFYETLPVTVFSIIFLLYISYIFNQLYYGKIVIIIISAILIAVAITRLIKKNSFNTFVKENILTPTMLVYFILIITFAFLAQDKLVGLWDELRLWGAYPKALHTFETLQLGENVMMYPIMQSYPPAMPLFCYFFTCFSAVFNENVLFFAYSFFGLVLMLPFTKYLKLSKWYNIVFFAFIIVLLPHLVYTFSSSYAFYYQSLFIDCTLGLYFGYSLMKARSNPYENKFKTYEFFVLLVCFGLLKDSGAFLAIACFLVSLIHYSSFKKERKPKKFIIGILISTSALLFSYLSWHFMLRIFAVNNHLGFSQNIPISSVISFLVKSIFSKTIYMVAILGVILVFIVYKYIYLRLDKSNIKHKIAFTVIQLASYASFIIGYFSIFSNSVINNSFPSFTRYMGTLAVCELYCFVTICIESFKDKDLFEFVTSKIKGKKKNFLKYILRIVSICILIVTSVFLIKHFKKNEELDFLQAKCISENITNQIESNQESENTSLINVFYISQDIPAKGARLHHRIYFNLIDKNIYIKNFYTETNINNLLPEEFINLLIEKKYDYIYVLNSSEEFENIFGKIFNYELNSDSSDILFSFNANNGKINIMD